MTILLEMPYFKKITFNLGTRQQGRIKSKSVIDVKIDSKSISKNIDYAMSNTFGFGGHNASLIFKKYVEIVCGEPLGNS